MWPFKNKKKKKQDLTPEQKSRLIREQALKNAKAARERIGEDTLDEVSKAIQRMEERKKNSVSNQAKRIIDQEGGEAAASHIRNLIDD